MKTIYVVEGQTGEYSDHNEWPVKAFVNEEAAKTLVLNAQARAREIEIEKNNQDFSDGGWYTNPKPSRFVNQFDPNMSMDYTGTQYIYYPIELVEE